MKNRILLSTIAVAMLAAGSLQLLAQDSDDVSDWSITIAPEDLLGVNVELAAETSVSDRGGFGGLLAFGTLDDYSGFDVGLLGSYAVLGNFDRSLHAGGRLTFSHRSWERDVDLFNDVVPVTATNIEVRLEGHVGLKYTLGFGLTTSVQGGGEIIFYRRALTIDGVEDPGRRYHDVGPTINWMIGWSF